MTSPSATQSGIKTFRVAIPESALVDLHERLARTRWPDHLPGVAGWDRGVPLEYLRELTEYWLTGYDWRTWETRLNRVPQFTTELDGQDIHFLHLRSPETAACPLLLIHGWPSSSVEFLRILEPLANPREHGTDPAEAFDVIAPSLPGYGFSTPVRQAGWGNLFRVAQAWAELMRRLGYRRYAVHGTDVGAGVAALLPLVDPGRVIATHVTGTVAAMPLGPALDPSTVPEPDRIRAERFNAYQAEQLGYLHLQATRPQTLAYALTDSPVGQLAWTVERFHDWTDPAAALPDDAVDRDQLLTLVTITWFTRAGASSAHATYEGMQAYRDMSSTGPEDHVPTPQVPSAVAVFAADTTIRAITDPAHEVQHWRGYDRGGHFPAMEVPDLLVQDLRDFLRHHG